jgi:hypothetical protein
MVGAASDIQRNGAKSVLATRMLEGPSLILVAPDPIRAWTIESSTDLRQWVPVVTNKVGTLQFSIEPVAGDAKRFFRVRMD